MLDGPLYAKPSEEQPIKEVGSENISAKNLVCKWEALGTV